jgi:hypothetical protein
LGEALRIFRITFIAFRAKDGFQVPIDGILNEKKADTEIIIAWFRKSIGKTNV